MQTALLSHHHNGYTNAPCCYVVHYVLYITCLASSRVVQQVKSRFPTAACNCPVVRLRMTNEYEALVKWRCEIHTVVSVQITAFPTGSFTDQKSHIDLTGLCIMQLAIRPVYTRPTHTQGWRGTGGRPSKPILLIFRPRTRLAKVFVTTCPNCGQFSEKFLCVFVD